MNRGRRTTWAIALLAFAAACASGRAFYRNRPQELWFDYYLLPPPPVLRVISIGHAHSLADLLYTSTTLLSDYYQDREERVRIDTIANVAAFRLDPDFREPIYFGHYFAEFSAFRPGGLGPEYDARLRALDQTSFLLLTGHHHGANSGQYASVLANEQLGLDRFPQVAHFAALAAAKEPSDPMPRVLMALAVMRGGDESGAEAIWERLERETRPRLDTRQKFYHAIATMRLLGLREKPRLEALRAKVDAFQARHGARPASWQEMVDRGDLKEIPLDALGRPFILQYGQPSVILAPLSGEDAFE